MKPEPYNARLATLESIEHHAKTAARHVDWAAYYVRQLLSQPEYETRAEDEAKKAIESIADSLDKLTTALTLYKSLPLDKKEIDHDAKDI